MIEPWTPERADALVAWAAALLGSRSTESVEASAGFRRIPAEWPDIPMGTSRQWYSCAELGSDIVRNVRLSACRAQPFEHEGN